VRNLDLGRRRTDRPGRRACAARPAMAAEAPATGGSARVAAGALRMSRAVRFAPLLVLLLIVAALVWRLATPVDTNVHSKLEGKAVPAFDLGPALDTKPPLSSRDLATGKPRILNIFASWCVPCISEVKVLKQLRARGVTIDGIAV